MKQTKTQQKENETEMIEYDEEKVIFLEAKYKDKKIIYTHGNKVRVEN